MRGHEILQKTKGLIEGQSYPIIYGDTDSVFILLDQVEGEVQAGARGLQVISTVGGPANSRTGMAFPVIWRSSSRLI